MAKRSGKSVSFDAMIKFFMIRFEIPTRQDIQRIVNRLDQLEKTIKKIAVCGKPKRSGNSKAGGGNTRIIWFRPDVERFRDHPECHQGFRSGSGLMPEYPNHAFR